MTTRTRTSPTTTRSVALSEPSGWVPDVLPGFEALTLPLATPTEPEETSPLVATLVRRAGEPDADRPAVVYVHGWNDYFFQTHLAEFFESVGYAFYGLDLHRYGRSLRDGQLGGYAGDLAEYDEELDAVRRVLRDAGHPAVVLHGHSTGGLVCVLHAAARPGRYAALVLNAPWLDMTTQPLVRRFSLGIEAVGVWRPTSVLPGSAPVDGPPSDYARTLHSSLDGPWDYDLRWKSNGDRFLARTGWMRAILRGQRQVAAGLGLEVPVLVLTSQPGSRPKDFDLDTMSSLDLVLDVEELAARAVRLGRQVTVVQVEGGMHDLALSRPAPRQRYFDAMERWLWAYGPVTSGRGMIARTEERNP